MQGDGRRVDIADMVVGVKLERRAEISEKLSAQRVSSLDANGFLHFNCTICTMPGTIHSFVAGLPEAERQSIMASLRNLKTRDPLTAAEAVFNIRPYKERHGKVYVQIRPNQVLVQTIPFAPAGQEVDYIDVKAGFTTNLTARRKSYEKKCKDEEIVWLFCYETSHPKLIERLTHLSLWALDAHRDPYACWGCGVRHQEHFCEGGSGGIENVAAIIEGWLLSSRGGFGDWAKFPNELLSFEITCDAKTYMSNKNPFVAVYLFKPSTESYLFIPEVKGRPPSLSGEAVVLAGWNVALNGISHLDSLRAQQNFIVCQPDARVGAWIHRQPFSNSAILECVAPLSSIPLPPGLRQPILPRRAREGTVSERVSWDREAQSTWGRVGCNRGPPKTSPSSIWVNWNGEAGSEAGSMPVRAYHAQAVLGDCNGRVKTGAMRAWVGCSVAAGRCEVEVDELAGFLALCWNLSVATVLILKLRRLREGHNSEGQSLRAPTHRRRRVVIRNRSWPPTQSRGDVVKYTDAKSR
ncbi:hypothetical protein B0H13DRAFT_1880053 [Mycena leptocephala]|nr:hypothetical protein B0H13DRAFT_1880053 [Mycena leptocephala]